MKSGAGSVRSVDLRDRSSLDIPWRNRSMLRAFSPLSAEVPWTKLVVSCSPAGGGPGSVLSGGGELAGDGTAVHRRRRWPRRLLAGRRRRERREAGGRCGTREARSGAAAGGAAAARRRAQVAAALRAGRGGAAAPGATGGARRAPRTRRWRRGAARAGSGAAGAAGAAAERAGAAGSGAAAAAGGSRRQAGAAGARAAAAARAARRCGGAGGATPGRTDGPTRRPETAPMGRPARNACALGATSAAQAAVTDLRAEHDHRLHRVGRRDRARGRANLYRGERRVRLPDAARGLRRDRQRPRPVPLPPRSSPVTVDAEGCISATLSLCPTHQTLQGKLTGRGVQLRQRMRGARHSPAWTATPSRRARRDASSCREITGTHRVRWHELLRERRLRLPGGRGRSPAPAARRSPPPSARARTS